MAAIGQSDHNYTVIALSRYVTAVASSGNVYDYTLLDHVESPDGRIFDGFPVEVAGKTGTAQQSGHANHALFVAYAPYSSPRISIATRIPFGYTSHNAADVSKNILGVYFKVKSSEKLLKGGANQVSTNGRVVD